MQAKTVSKPLRLSKPDYWNKFDPAYEASCLADWESERLTPEPLPGAAPWRLQDGPPYANGEPHLGHFLNKLLKDAFARRAAGSGMAVEWRGGWDCHGLPLEMAAEKALGTREAHKDVFLEECRAQARHWGGRQAEGFRSLGLLMDFDRAWRTMDSEYESRLMSLLLDLRVAGLLVESKAPMRWCPACRSSLAASELEPGKSSRSELGALTPLKTVSPEVRSLFSVSLDETLYLAYWTTTPWTLPSNAAFALPLSGEGYLVDLSGRKAFLGRAGLLKLKTLGLPHDVLTDFLWEDVSSSFQGMTAVSPLSGATVPVHPHRLADTDQGLGAVHLAPAFGPEDHEASMELGFPWGDHVGHDGRFLSMYPGVGLKEGTALCSEAVRASGMELFLETSVVEDQRCWRHKAPVFWKSSMGYVLDLDLPFGTEGMGLSQRAMTMLDEMGFFSDDRTKASLERMLRGRRFWNLSRRRSWGVPFPVYRSLSDGSEHPETERLWRECVEGCAKHGVAYWDMMPDLPGYEKETQVADVWFDSGASLFASTGDASTRAQLALEGKDQTRGWFLSSLLLGAFLGTRAPFDNVLAHGFVVDAKGRKLSKSEGNAPDNSETLKFGAEALRLWALGQNPKDEVAWSPKALERGRDEQTAWRSTLRFFLANMGSEDETPVGYEAHLRQLDHLALRRLAAVEEQVSVHFDTGRPDLALAALRDFRSFMSKEWFELSKRMLYCAEDGNPELMAVRAVMRRVFSALCFLLDPFMPFSVWEALKKGPLSLNEARALCEDLPSSDLSLSERAEELLSYRDNLLPLLERSRENGEKGQLFLSVPDDLPLKTLVSLFPGVCVEKSDDGSAKAWKAQDGYHKCPRCWTLSAESFPGGEECPECSEGWGESKW